THVVAAASACVFVVVLLWMKDRPSDKGLLPYGARAGSDAGPVTPAYTPLAGLGWAARSREFWILAGSFFVCGASTSGLVGTHLIAACTDKGMTEVAAASMLGVMAVFNFAGATGSGWLSDRVDNRVLLAVYYGLRGLSLLYLPFAFDSFYTMGLFTIFYGLDWIATIPPTVRLTANA